MSKLTSNSFLPEDYLRRKRESRALILNLALFTGLIALVGGAFIVTNRQWTEVRGEQQRVNAEYEAEAQKIEQLKKLDEQRQELMYRAEVTNALIERVLRSVLLAEIVNRMPPTATLSELVLESTRAPEPPAKAVVPQAQSLTGGGVGEAKKEVVRRRPLRLDFKLSITGLCANDTEVADFQTSLMKSPLLDRVDLMSTVEHIDGERQLRRFRMEASIKPDADTSTIVPLALRRNGDPVKAAEARVQEQANPRASAGSEVEADKKAGGFGGLIGKLLDGKPASAKGGAKGVEGEQTSVDPSSQRP